MDNVDKINIQTDSNKASGKNFANGSTALHSDLLTGVGTGAVTSQQSIPFNLTAEAQQKRD